MISASPGENHIFHFNYIFKVSDNFWPQLYVCMYACMHLCMYILYVGQKTVQGQAKGKPKVLQH